MKNIFKATLLLGLASSMALTGCIEEVQPTDGITQEQLDSSIKAGMATLFAIPANMVEYSTLASWHGNFGYPGFMQVRDRLLDEMVCAESGTTYNQWSFYEQARFSKDYWMPQVVWVFYSKQNLACNKALQTYPADIESDEGKGARAVALAYRAMILLDAARWFEFLPNDKTSNINADGNDVLNLTIPVVTETMTEQEARKNPRMPHDKMVEFLLNDLEYAEENIDNAPADLKIATFPNKAVVYGLMARTYLWDEDYTNAAIYADKAIAAASGKRPLTETEWTDPKTGFNTLDNNSWLWGMQLTDQTSAVRTGICNFTSMVSVETTYGYAGVGAGAYPSVGRSFFDRVNANDFRKSSWCPRAGQLSLITRLQLNRYTGSAKTSFVKSFEYGPVKFRPGQGNCTEYSVASATAIPLMRIEEMHFIKMESVAHSNAAEGKRLIEEFMNTYRMRPNYKYTCTPTDVEGVVEEIVFQKRVEFWGEGLNFFDVKRLGYPVTRAYTNTNFYEDCRFNTEGRPAWFNMPFVSYEGENNEAMEGWNNPDTDGLYQPVKD